MWKGKTGTCVLDTDSGGGTQLTDRCQLHGSLGSLPVVAVAGDAGADAELPLPTVPLCLDTSSDKEEALPVGSTEERYFEIS